VTDVSDPTVLVRARGGLGSLTLNRPRAINALDLGMIHQVHAALDAWEHDSEVDIVVLDGAGERGLCAGGDVRGLADRVVNRRL
jgi:enoyl-CoA hydratase